MLIGKCYEPKETSPVSDPNRALDEALQRSGWTPEQLALAVNARLRAEGHVAHQVHPKTPWKWLRGQTPHPPLPGYVADVLSERVGLPFAPADLGLTSSRAVSAVPADDGLSAPYDTAGADTVVSEMALRGHADTRRFAPLRGPALTQHAHLWLVADVPDARPVAEAALSAPSRLAAFRAVIETLRRLDDQEGGRSVFPWSAREALWAMAVLKDTAEAGRPAMYRVVAELAELSGWAATDAGQHAVAQRWLVAALHASQAVGDREHGAYVLCLMGFNATLAGRHSDAVTMLESAQVGARNVASLTVRSILTGFEARARAASGDRAGFERTLSRGTGLYERARAADAPPWAYWMMEQAEFPTPLENGRALTMVGMPDRAVEVLTPKVAAMAEYPRDAVLTQAYLAEAHLAAGDREQSGAYASLARAGLASGVQSPRTAAVLADLPV